MSGKITPMMAQYLSTKAEHPGAILLFRMGDFYEVFFEDAKEAAAILGLTLTTRGQHQGQPIPMAGVPWHSVQGYIRRLVEAGRRVAICEQVENPKQAKGIVRREVTEVITPGTMMPDDIAAEVENRFVAAVVPGASRVGLALVDLSTADFLVGEFAPSAVADELLRYRPAEVLIADGVDLGLPPELAAVVTPLAPSWQHTPARGQAALCRHFGVSSLDGFGADDLMEGAVAAAALLDFLRELKGDALAHLTRMRRLRTTDELFLDAASLTHLEVLEAPEGGRSLREVIDRTRTAMGGRFLRRALSRPLARVPDIEARQDAVAALLDDAGLRHDLGEALGATFDLERLCGRLGAGRAGPRDLVSLRRTLAELPGIRSRLETHAGRLGALAGEVRPLPDVSRELERALLDEPPLLATEGGIFREGYSPELDEIRRAATEGKDWIARLQEDERARTGIANLKVGYNRVFGYFLEVTKSNLRNVPDDYQRKQTLVNAERFVTPALKEKESAILGAEERQHELEAALFDELRTRVAEELPGLLSTATALAEIDVLRSLAEVAASAGWVRPEVHDGLELHLHEARHPVVEAQLREGVFIPNDLELVPDRRQILLITGPNMAGKSTYLRQVGLLVLLAQVGSFVPARSASIGVADRIFTRVGASDNLARGQSTFLVEMNETSNILHNATSRSVVLLDEVGRGTSTFDGLSLAWAITEHLHDGMEGRPRTLFATHFHELTRLAERLRRVENYRVEVKEWDDRVVFLHKIVAGKADRSYGIHVARMAGLPEPVVARAAVILEALEADGAARAGTDRAIQTVLPWGATDPIPGTNGRSTPTGVADAPAGGSGEPEADRSAPPGDRLDPEAQAVLDELRAADPDAMTPLEALTLVSRVKGLLGTRR